MPLTITAQNAPNLFLHGKRSRAIITTGGGTPVNTAFTIEKGDINIDPSMQNTTSSEDAGWGSCIDGTKMVTGNLTFIYDMANKPFAPALGFRPGAAGIIEIILDGRNADDTVNASPTEVYGGPVRWSKFSLPFGPQGGKVEVSVDFMGNGAWTLPPGT